jgi:hypothetical protein
MHILSSYQLAINECQRILAYFPDSEKAFSLSLTAQVLFFSIPLELLVTKGVVNDTLLAMRYPVFSMIYLNQ